MNATTKFKAISKEEAKLIIENSSLPEKSIAIDGKAEYLHQEYQDFESRDLDKLHWNCGCEEFGYVWHSKEEAIDSMDDKDNFCVQVEDFEEYDYEL